MNIFKFFEEGPNLFFGLGPPKVQDWACTAAIHKQSDIVKNEYIIRLNASIDVSRYLLNGALPFCGHDESENSLHKGHFLEMIKYIQTQNESVRKVILKNAPWNN